VTLFLSQGHVETIFDCKFKPDDPNILATASFDGTIKVWDINTLTAVYTSPGNEGVVYSLSWAPGKNDIYTIRIAHVTAADSDRFRFCVTLSFISMFHCNPKET